MALRVAPVVVGFGIIWFQADRLVAVRDGVFVTAESALRDAPVVVGFGIIRFQTDRLIVVRDGVFVPAESVLRDAPVVVGSGIIGFQADRLVVGVDGFLRAGFFPVQVTGGEPRLGSELVIGSVRDAGDSAPLLDGLFVVSLSLKQDGGGDCSVDGGRRGIGLDASHGLVGLVRFRRGGLGGYSFHQRVGLVSTFFDLGDQFPRLFGVSSGRIDIPARFRLDLAEPLETEIAGDDGADAE